MVQMKPSFKRKLVNIIQSTFIIAGTGLILALAAYLIFGVLGVISALLIWMIIVLIIPALDPHAVIKLYKGRKLEYYESPNLYEALYELSKKADLKAPPALYYIPSSEFISFSTGSRDNSALAVSDGVLRVLSLNEIYGVMGHEISHIANNDIKLMQITDIASKIANLAAYLGQAVMIVVSPFLALEHPVYFWSLFFIFISIPVITVLMQLSLSRIREYGADLDAAILTGNPLYLKNALIKLDKIESHILNHLFNPFSKTTEPSLLRTHPPTQKRIEKLNELQLENHEHDTDAIISDKFLDETPVIIVKPKRRYGLWF